MKPVEVGRDKHLIIKAIDRVIKRHAVEPYLDARVRKQALQMNHRIANPARECSPSFRDRLARRPQRFRGLRARYAL